MHVHSAAIPSRDGWFSSNKSNSPYLTSHVHTLTSGHALGDNLLYLKIRDDSVASSGNDATDDLSGMENRVHTTEGSRPRPRTA